MCGCIHGRIVLCPICSREKPLTVFLVFGRTLRWSHAMRVRTKLNLISFSHARRHARVECTLTQVKVKSSQPLVRWTALRGDQADSSHAIIHRRHSSGSERAQFRFAFLLAGECYQIRRVRRQESSSWLLLGFRGNFQVMRSMSTGDDSWSFSCTCRSNGLLYATTDRRLRRGPRWPALGPTPARSVVGGTYKFSFVIANKMSRE